MEQFAVWHSNCINTVYFQTSSKRSFVSAVVFCSLTVNNLIWVVYAV